MIKLWDFAGISWHVEWKWNTYYIFNLTDVTTDGAINVEVWQWNKATQQLTTSSLFDEFTQICNEAATRLPQVIGEWIAFHQIELLVFSLFWAMTKAELFLAPEAIVLIERSWLNHWISNRAERSSTNCINANTFVFGVNRWYSQFSSWSDCWCVSDTWWRWWWDDFDESNRPNKSFATTHTLNWWSINNQRQIAMVMKLFYIWENRKTMSNRCVVSGAPKSVNWIQEKHIFLSDFRFPSPSLI